MPRHLTQKQKSLLDEHRYAAKPEDIPRSAWEALEQLNDFETLYQHVQDYLHRHHDPEAKEVKSWWMMSSLKECLKEYQAQDIGLISDIAKHGCSGGVAGVTYYSETEAFHARHEGEIWELLQRHADENGLMKGNMLLHISKDPGSLTHLVNDLVWWALEVTAQELVQLQEKGSSCR